MTVLRDRLVQLLRRGQSLPILHRIAIGNALIIIVGAVGGTLLTLHLAGAAAAPGLIAFFATVGIGLSVLINAWIIRAALRPLRQLRATVEQLTAGEGGIGSRLPVDGDPDIRQLAAAINQLQLQVEARNDQLRALSERFISAQEEERQRIARSLHDDTVQSLTSLAIGLERLERQLPASLDGTRAELVALRERVVSTLDELRHIIYGLRPAILDDLGLVPAIRWYARATLEPAGVRVELRAPDEALDLPPEQAINLFRIAQEAVSNIVRHAAAHQATIDLYQDGGRAHLVVADDGRGFDVEGTTGQAVRLRQLGLLGIRERAQLLGGDVAITSAPGQGTRVMVSLPLASPPEAAVV